MRISKKGKRWYILHEENGKQIWKSTGLTNKADAEELLVKRRKEKERVDAGLAPSVTDSKLGYLEAVEVFLSKKTQLEEGHQALLRGRLLTGAYQMFRIAEGHPIDKVKYYRKRKLKEEVIPYLKTKRLMELTPAVVEGPPALPWRTPSVGWQYPEVWRFIEEKRKQLMEASRRRGRPVDRRTPEGKAFFQEWTLPYDPTKFPNKWWKLLRDKPVRTLMAHLGKDSYSHIHYDSKQARPISIREAARLQSFPDGFVLCGSMNPALKQIGNAVPSLLAYAIAMAMRNIIGCQRICDIRCDLLGLDPRLITTTAGRA